MTRIMMSNGATYELGLSDNRILDLINSQRTLGERWLNISMIDGTLHINTEQIVAVLAMPDKKEQEPKKEEETDESKTV